MTSPQKEALQKQIAEHNRRLQLLKERYAKQGIETPPSVITEIEDIEAEIAELQTKIEAIPEIARQNPYRGLSAFREEDAGVFFGRETFTAQLVERVQQKPLVAVLGPSGSGKSSVVFAGLIPALENDEKNRWLIASFRPGSDPFMGLAGALMPLLEPGLSKVKQIGEARDMAARLREERSPLSDYIDHIHQMYADHRLLVIADQFEELYTLTQETTTHQQFLDLLLPTIDTTKVQLLLTLRADFLGQALLYAPFSDALQHNIELLRPMSLDELRMAIEKPAERREISLEPGLAERILKDIESEPGNLPLLEFALAELWKQQKQGQLTHAAYDAIGCVEGALSNHADKVFEDLGEADQEQIRRLFLRLVQPGEGTEDTRRLVTKTELGEANWSLAQRLANERLVVTDQDLDEIETVEVAHEALIRGWQQLRNWIDTDRSFLNWQKRLRFALSQWQESKQDEGALLRGALLDEAEKHLKDRDQDLGEHERDYIKASIALREGEEYREKDYEKLRLVSEIFAQGGQGRDLSEDDLSGAHLRNANLREANLSGANLIGTDLRGADLKGANLREANLSGANLSEANLIRVDLRQTQVNDETQLDSKWRLVWEIVNQGAEGRVLTKANLGGASLIGADLRRVNLKEANLRWTSLNEANLRGADLTGADLTEADLAGADLSGVNLIRADLTGADLSGVNLIRANLLEANLRGANLRQTQVDDTTQLDGKWRLVWEIINQGVEGLILTKADLSGASLIGADLRRANLRGANLKGADLKGADLSEANLSRANLFEADLSEANLKGGQLIGVILFGVNLKGANLGGANLKGTYLTNANLEGAKYDAYTDWSDEFDPYEAGAELVED